MLRSLAAKYPKETSELFVAVQAVGALLLAINAAAFGWRALPGLTALGWAACCVASAANVVLAFVYLRVQRKCSRYAAPVACAIWANWAAMGTVAVLSSPTPDTDAAVLVGKVTGSDIVTRRGDWGRQRFVLGVAAEPSSVSYVCGKRCGLGLVSIAAAHPPEVRYVAAGKTLIYLEADGEVVLPREVGVEGWKAERRRFLIMLLIALAALCIGGALSWRTARRELRRASVQALSRFSP